MNAPIFNLQGYPLEYANPQKRFHYVHTQAELDQQAKLTGLERVRLAICTVKDLLPDDDARIFTQVLYMVSIVEWSSQYYVTLVTFAYSAHVI